MSVVGEISSYSLNTFRNIDGVLIDVRSPKEFLQGHWPGATNIPLFNNEARSLIGTTYKHNGREKAILLGIKLITPRLKELKEILNKQIKKSSSHNLKIYCWRGGLRSASLARFAYLLGLNAVLLDGGYKTYRAWSLKQFEKEWPLRLIGGKTGTGKTSLIQELSKMKISTIDLEGLANHKGSSFGGIGLPPQPSCEQYENLLAEELFKSEKSLSKGIWLEAESASLGKCRIPNKLFTQMKSAPVLLIKKSRKERVQILVKEYSQHDKDQLKEATLRISKRLGPERTTKALQSIQNGLWEEACLAMLDYYDKCYEYELEKIVLKKTIDLSGLSSKASAKHLIKLDHVY